MARIRQTHVRSAQSRKMLDVSLNSQTPVQTPRTKPPKELPNPPDVKNTAPLRHYTSKRAREHNDENDNYNESDSSSDNDNDDDDLYAVSPQSRKPHRPNLQNIKPVRKPTANPQIPKTLFSDCPFDVRTSNIQPVKTPVPPTKPTTKISQPSHDRQSIQTRTVGNDDSIDGQRKKQSTSALQALYDRRRSNAAVQGSASENFKHAPQQGKKVGLVGGEQRTAVASKQEERAINDVSEQTRSVLPNAAHSRSNAVPITPANRRSIGMPSNMSKVPLNGDKSVKSRKAISRSRQAKVSYGEKARRKVGQLPLQTVSRPSAKKSRLADTKANDDDIFRIEQPILSTTMAEDRVTVKHTHTASRNGLAELYPQKSAIPESTDVTEPQQGGRLNKAMHIVSTDVTKSQRTHLDPSITSVSRNMSLTKDYQPSAPSHVSNTPRQALTSKILQSERESPGLPIPELELPGITHDCPVYLSDGDQSVNQGESTSPTYDWETAFVQFPDEPRPHEPVASFLEMLHTSPGYEDVAGPLPVDAGQPLSKLRRSPSSKSISVVRPVSSNKSGRPSPQTRNVATTVADALDEILGMNSFQNIDAQSPISQRSPAPEYDIASEYMYPGPAFVAEMIADDDQGDHDEHDFNGRALPMSEAAAFTLDTAKDIPPERGLTDCANGRKGRAIRGDLEAHAPAPSHQNDFESEDRRYANGASVEYTNHKTPHVQQDDLLEGSNAAVAMPTATLKTSTDKPSCPPRQFALRKTHVLEQTRPPTAYVDNGRFHKRTNFDIEAVDPNTSHVDNVNPNTAAARKEFIARTTNQDPAASRGSQSPRKTEVAARVGSAKDPRTKPRTSLNDLRDADDSRQVQAITPLDSMSERLRALEDSLVHLRKHQADTTLREPDLPSQNDRTSTSHNYTYSSPLKRRRLQSRIVDDTTTMNPPIEPITATTATGAPTRLDGLSRWRHALQPHQLDLFDELIAVSHRVVRGLVSRETAEQHRIEDFLHRGTRTTDQTMADVTEKFGQFAGGVDTLRRRMRDATTAAQKKVAAFEYGKVQQRRSRCQRQVRESEVWETELSTLLTMMQRD